MSLESPAFEFGLNGNERKVGANAPLPVTLSWTPTPKYAGELALLLRLKSVPRATLSINGERQRISGNDDIPLPVKVDNAGGVSRFWWFWATVFGTVVLAVIGSAIQIYEAWKK